MKQKNTVSDLKIYKSSDFMRARRPEYFSDSKYEETIRFSREMFENYLETITSRKQEIEFEHFCRRLAEKEICPNLLPQTGPTGGGDSKVDSETIPVADEIANRWYDGVGRDASKERWAFAFSAKADWLPKVRSDVDKIEKTKRDYKKCFFITNQYVRDKERAAIEDELSKKHNVDVRILDRTWIVKCIYENKRFGLAVETLHIEEFDIQKNEKPGPRDIERKQALETLEKQINDSDRYQGLNYQLAEDSLQAAILARGLELPKVEVQGRFERALNVARKVNIQRQLLRFIYTKAWTEYWWYDDLGELNRLYDDVEKLAAGTNQVDDLEHLSNLWHLLYASSMNSSIDPQVSKIVERTTTLEKEFDRLASDQIRPTSALTARSFRIMMDITKNLRDPEKLASSLEELKNILQKSEQYITFFTDVLIKEIQELGPVLISNKQYEDLLELAITITQKRKSDSEAGKMFFKRGSQKLRATKIYEALKYFGRARGKLLKDEYRSELIATFVGCILSYEKAGLLWAARISNLAVINELMSEFVENAKINPRVIKYMMKMVWLELQLGRIPCAMVWMDFVHLTHAQVELDKESQTAFEKERRHQDIALSTLFLKMDLFDLKSLDFLPELLDKRGLDISWLSLLYALGYEDLLRKNKALPETESSETVREIFWKGVNSPDIPEKPELLLQRKVTFKSFVVGCEVVFTVENELPSIYLSETILGVLESFLATSLQDIMPTRSRFDIEIKPDEKLKELCDPRIIDVDGNPQMQILHPINYKYDTIEERKQFESWLLKTILMITIHIGQGSFNEDYFKKAAQEEDLFNRALNYSEVRILTENVLGTNPRYSISDWEKETVSEKYPIKRDLIWSHGLMKPVIVEAPGKEEQADNESQELAERFGMDSMKHTDRKFISLIELNLWDQAKWNATIYVHEEQFRMPPLLGIAFEDVDYGKLIFEHWRKQFGEKDENERLRVSIIKGIDTKNPASYKIVLGSNLTSYSAESEGKQWVTISRINRMEPKDSVNLDRFLMLYGKFKAYFLAPASAAISKGQYEFFPELGLLKEEIYVIDAWRLKLTDPELSAIGEKDDIIVPEGVTEVPLYDALEKIKQMKLNTSK